MKKMAMGLIALTLSTSSFAMMEPNDAEVATTMATINNGEIKVSKLAQERAMNPKVKEFANMMVKEHQTNLDTTMALAKKINLQEKQTETSMKMKEENLKEYNALSKLKGKQFDEAYMAAMVRNHKDARLKIDQSLVPYAKNPELKTMLMETQKKVEMHLDHAQKVESAL